MAESSSSPLHSFLADTRAKLMDKDRPWPGRLHVVMGNEAADADTIVSSLCYSYLLHRTKPPGEEDDLLHAPVLPIPRQDFPLRTETSMLFNTLQLPISGLIFMDDGLNLSSFHEKGKLRLTLTDHNGLASSWAHFGESVHEILDHHKDLEMYPWIKGPKRVVAFAMEEGTGEGTALVGSACTLVVEKYLSAGPHLLDPTIAKLLLGVILLDTVNLDPKARKVTPRDEAAVATLQKVVGVEGKEALTRLYNTLNDVKTDPSWWGSLSAYDALRYDYKQFTVPSEGRKRGGEVVYGMSSVLMPIEDFLSKPHLLESTSRFFQERGLDILIILSFVAKPSYRRSIAMYSSDQPWAQALAQVLTLQPPETRGLELSVLDPPERVWCFDQGNTAASRKQVEPLFRALLAKL